MHPDRDAASSTASETLKRPLHQGHPFLPGFNPLFSLNLVNPRGKTAQLVALFAPDALGETRRDDARRDCKRRDARKGERHRERGQRRSLPPGIRQIETKAQWLTRLWDSAQSDCRPV